MNAHSTEQQEIAELKDVLIRNGFRRCDIAACNCGSWHFVGGLRQRFEEIKDALSDAGHPLTNENGNLVLGALQDLIAERDAAIAASSKRIPMSWVCNECDSHEFTDSLSRADLEYLACSGCGCDEFHLEPSKGAS